MATAGELSGYVSDPEGSAVSGVRVSLVSDADFSHRESQTDSQGRFLFSGLEAGEYRLGAVSPAFMPVARTVALADGGRTEDLRFAELAAQRESVTVTADANAADLLAPDPSGRVFARQDVLDANPGRPGVPVSIPGFPIETASGGIKAPQYFAPGVAGDHGEPVAQYIAIGDFLLPNNLSANAHGNGYADPNLLIPAVIESVRIDGGAFDVREGNHAVNLAASYGLASQLDPFLTVTGDYRDADIAAGINPSAKSWLALEGSFGNGFLSRPEHRRQYKLNGERMFEVGAHRLTLLGIGYYGRAYVPGLIPIFAPHAEDTIDPRQKDQTHTALLALTDVWTLTSSQELQLSGFFRTYNLSLDSDFGEGLIRQSEFRTVGGGSVNYLNRISERFALLGGLDYEREAPRRDDLDSYGVFDPSRPTYYGPFRAIDANNLTLGSVTPYVAAEGSVTRFFRYYVGWRRDEIEFRNQDLLVPGNSFEKLVGVNSPKASLSFLPRESWFVPRISLSFGQAFFTEDPRIGLGNSGGTPVATAHAWQLVASKSIFRTELRVTLGRVTTSAELAKIDPDTGLQFDQGPGRMRFVTVALRRTYSGGTLQASVSKADARDLISGQPTPEAPRTILDFLGSTQKLPFHLQAKGEFEYVGRKPLGTGCDPVDLNSQCLGMPVTEFRGSVVRPFLNGRLDAGVQFLIARGYSGQTTENLLPSEIQQVVGVRIPSYASLAFTYRFGRGR